MGYFRKCYVSSISASAFLSDSLSPLQNPKGKPNWQLTLRVARICMNPYASHIKGSTSQSCFRDLHPLPRKSTLLCSIPRIHCIHYTREIIAPSYFRSFRSRCLRLSKFICFWLTFLMSISKIRIFQNFNSRRRNRSQDWSKEEQPTPLKKSSENNLIQFIISMSRG